MRPSHEPAVARARLAAGTYAVITLPSAVMKELWELYQMTTGPEGFNPIIQDYDMERELSEEQQQGDGKRLQRVARFSGDTEELVVETGKDCDSDTPFLDQCRSILLLMGIFLNHNGIAHKGLHTADVISLLRSLAGCARQVFHYDYDKEQLGGTPPDQQPLVLIAPLDSHCHMHFMDECGTEEIVSLVRGQALIFPGSLRHAGGGYRSQNTRVHMYINSKAASEKGEHTHFFPRAR